MKTKKDNEKIVVLKLKLTPKEIEYLNEIAHDFQTICDIKCVTLCQKISGAIIEAKDYE
jgi:hypothetical protein